MYFKKHSKVNSGMHPTIRQLCDHSKTKTMKSLILLFEWPSYIFDPSVVMAVCINDSGLSLLTGKLSQILSSSSMAILAANSYPSAILMGWIPQSNSCSACSRSAPARTVMAATAKINES